jgi:hypothetical protein
MKPAKFGIMFSLLLVQANEITTAQDSAESDASAKETKLHVGGWVKKFHSVHRKSRQQTAK